jgi:hypothetical protein
MKPGTSSAGTWMMPSRDGVTHSPFRQYTAGVRRIP